MALCKSRMERFFQPEESVVIVSRARDMAFNEDQPRDDHGRWGSGSSGLTTPSLLDVKRPVIGIIGANGDVQARNPTTRFNDHDQLFGERRPGHQRFRVVGEEVQWDDTPTDDDRFAVENFLAKRGVNAVRHKVFPLSMARGLAAQRRSAIDLVAEKHEAPIRAAFARAFEAGRKALRKTEPDVDAAVAAIEKALADLNLSEAFTAGGVVGLSYLKKLRNLSEFRTLAKRPLDFVFDGTNERAAEWAREHAGELIKDISDSTRESVARAVATYHEGYGDKDDLWEDVLDAVGDETRASLIASHEAITAANAGQREGWNQAADKGLLSADAERVWIATPGACPLCDALDGETAPLDGEYPEEGGDGPPLHPRCRCTEGLRP